MAEPTRLIDNVTRLVIMRAGMTLATEGKNIGGTSNLLETDGIIEKHVAAARIWVRDAMMVVRLNKASRDWTDERTAGEIIKQVEANNGK